MKSMVSSTLFLLTFFPLQTFGHELLPQNYTFRYMIHNTAPGLVHGAQTFEVLIKKNNAISVADCTAGIMLSSKKEASGLDEIMKVILAKENKHHVQYDERNFPQEITIQPITHTNMVGYAHAKIFLFDYKGVDENFSLKENIQKRYFDLSYKKWSKLHLSNYTVRYQDTAIETKHVDGVRIKVSDNQIASITDEFTLKSINASDMGNYPTIEDIFILIKGGIKRTSCQIGVDYDREYGYPTYIKYVCPQNNIREILLFNLKKD